MAYALCNGVSFCDVAGRILFLDLPQDRYFCLPPEGEKAFRRLISQDTADDKSRQALDRLATRGLLCHSSDNHPIAPCSPPFAAERSLLDAPVGSVTPQGLVGAAFDLAAVPLELRMFGLAQVIGRTARRKHKATGHPRDDAQSVVAAFQYIGSVLTTHDRCLPRSIAIARRLIALGHRPDLLIGVKLQPFKAHCWVQLGTVLVNERPDVTRAFTPILAI